MRLLMYILYISISCNLLAGKTYYVNNSSSDCIGDEVFDCNGGDADPGNGLPQTPYCCIQNAINKIEVEALEGDCIFNAYTYCEDSGSDCDDMDVDCTNGQTMENCPATCNLCTEEEVGSELLNFAKVCSVQVALGKYKENLIIEQDMVIISDYAAVGGFTLDPNDNWDQINLLPLPTIEPPPPSSGEEECSFSTMTIRPDDELCTNSILNLCADSPEPYISHPHVNINGFKIISDEGTRIPDAESGEKSIVGGAIYAYLAIPQVNNCIFREPEDPEGRPYAEGNNKLYATDDPVDIIYPALAFRNCGDYSPDTTEHGGSYLGFLDWPWDVNLTNNSFFEPDITTPQTVPQIVIDGFTDNTINLKYSIFNVCDEPNGLVSEYWVKGLEKDGVPGEVATFNIDDSKSMLTPLTGDIVEIDPALPGEDDCNADNKCKTIHAALSRMIPSLPKEDPKVIELPAIEFYINEGGICSTIPIIGGISFEGKEATNSYGETIKTSIDALNMCRIFTCQDMQNTLVTISNIEIKQGKALQGNGGGILLNNCSPTLENVSITNNESEGKGGGLYLGNNSNPLLKGVEITNNTSLDNGGGLYCDNSNPVIRVLINANNDTTYSKISANKVQGYDETKNYHGGGIYSNWAVLDLDNVKVENNEIDNYTGNTTSGVGIYIKGQPYGSATHLTNVDVTGSKASVNGYAYLLLGAGIYIEDSEVVIDGGKIENNGKCSDNDYNAGYCERAKYGAGIYVTDSEVTINSVTVSNHYALAEGGGIWLNNVFNSQVIDSEISHSEKGIYVENTWGLTLQNVKIMDHSEYGIKSKDSYNMTIKYVEIFNNSGIGIQSDHSEFFMHNVTMSNNEYGISATGGGGCIISNSIIWNSPIYLSANNAMFINHSNYSGINDVDVYYAGQDAIETSGDPNIVWGTMDGDEIINNNLDGVYPDTTFDMFNPIFINPDIEDFNLDPSSLCLDKGTVDLSNEDFPDYPEITDYDCVSPDMGANELYGFEDGCGVCNGPGPDEGYNCDGSCSITVDCFGVCGGDAVEDNCGICDGNNECFTGCMDELACNYESDFTIDDSESCTYVLNEECEECLEDADGVGVFNYIYIPGDLNEDTSNNVLDLVLLANCILAQDCEILYSSCVIDMDGNNTSNVLDLVILANCVLEQDCDSRVDDASESRIIMKENSISIEADGFVGGVQMTLTHGTDFSIEMTKRALHADYITTGNETRLLVITPETDELFSYIGDFEITEIIVANSQNEVSVDITRLQRYNLSEAYPNPFNPSTNISYSIPLPSDILLQVYDLRGRIVETLFSGYKDTGKYLLTWNADSYSSGLYLIKMTAIPANNQADTYHKTRRLLLIK